MGVAFGTGAESAFWFFLDKPDLYSGMPVVLLLLPKQSGLVWDNDGQQGLNHEYELDSALWLITTFPLRIPGFSCE